MLVVKCSRTWWNGPQKRNYYTKKGHWKLYFYDDSGNFHSKVVNRFTAFYINHFKKHHKVQSTKCHNCSSVFRYVGEPQCPKCL